MCRQRSNIGDMLELATASILEDDTNFQLELNEFLSHDADSTILVRESVLVVPSSIQFFADNADESCVILCTPNPCCQQARPLLACSPSMTWRLHLQRMVHRNHLKHRITEYAPRSRQTERSNTD